MRRLGPWWWMWSMLVGPISGSAQELVINGSFEVHARCPVGPVRDRLKVDGRVKGAQGHPDLYAACSEQFGVPVNWSGSQPAWDGDAYIGLALTTDLPDECSTREYVQLPLQQPLENGRRYRVTFHVSAAEGSGYVTDRVGARFSTDDLSRKGLRGGMREQPHVENGLDRFLNDTTGWTKVTGVYNAMGGERFIQIGNFHPCGRSSRVRMDRDNLRTTQRKTANAMDPLEKRGRWRNWMAHAAYAYLDGVSVVPDSTAPNVIMTLTPERACPAGTPPAIGPELIPDPGFDRNVRPAIDSWRNASDGTPDMLDGRTGLYLFSAAYRDNREYIRTPLLDTLDPCTTYRIAMDVQRNGSYAYATDAIGVVVTDTFSTRRDRMRMDLQWAWHSPLGHVLDADEPLTLCGTFTPRVCAHQLLLGNFAPDSAITVIHAGRTSEGPFAYYHVDNVHLNAVSTVPGCIDPCAPTVAMNAVRDEGSTPNVKSDGPVPWPDEFTLHFPSDSELPLGVDADALDRLAVQLLDDPAIQVYITGHADDSGTEVHNARLALRRAEHMRDLLVQRGIAIGRIFTTSAGSEAPVADNATPEGRALNRRVEVMLR